jgi:quercetin dioxygenase-like cupin family protein
MAAVALTAGAFFALQTSASQQSGTRRTQLQRRDVSTTGREVLQVRVDLDAGVVFGEHSHPGEELVYVIEGSLEYRLEGRPPAILKAGDALLIPTGVVHSVKNLGRGNGSELATYIVEKGKPLLTMAR